MHPGGGRAVGWARRAGHGGSADHHTDVRGLGPQVGSPQEGALTRNAAGQAGAHNTDGVQACDGGAPARRTDQRTSSADHEQLLGMASSGGHLSP